MQGGVSRGSGLQWSRSNTFSQLCLYVAGPLLLKCNHSNLLLWFPIERISHVSAQRRISSLLQSGFGISLFVLTCSYFLPACPSRVTRVCKGAVQPLLLPTSSHEPLDQSLHFNFILFLRHVELNSLKGFWGSRFKEASWWLTLWARATIPSPGQLKPHQQQRCVGYSELTGYFEGRNHTLQHLRCTWQPWGARISLATSQECVYEIVPSLGINWRLHFSWW